jgi:UDP-N-acetylglucosamine:LPS N-acetylglucosamine transferase
MLLEREMTGPALLEALSGLLKNREKRSEMASRARTFAHPDAATRIAQMIAALAAAPR